LQRLWAEWKKPLIGFVFGRNHVCDDLRGLENLTIIRKPNKCDGPCNKIYENQQVTAQMSPVLELGLPFTLATDDRSALTSDFYDPEGTHGPMWSQRRSVIRFLLAKDWHAAPIVRMRITGVALPNRAAELTLNGRHIGTISGSGPVSAEFKLDQSVFHAGGENQLVFSLDRAGPVGADPRLLGFSLNQIQFLPGT
jgi:hypothetical protein